MIGRWLTKSSRAVLASVRVTGQKRNQSPLVARSAGVRRGGSRALLAKAADEGLCRRGDQASGSPRSCCARAAWRPSLILQPTRRASVRSLRQFVSRHFARRLGSRPPAGSHVRMKKAGRWHALVVPLRREIRRGTLAGILRAADLSAADLRGLPGLAVAPASPRSAPSFKSRGVMPPLRNRSLAGRFVLSPSATTVTSYSSPGSWKASSRRLPRAQRRGTPRRWRVSRRGVVRRNIPLLA